MKRYFIKSNASETLNDIFTMKKIVQDKVKEVYSVQNQFGCTRLAELRDELYNEYAIYSDSDWSQLTPSMKALIKVSQGEIERAILHICNELRDTYSWGKSHKGFGRDKRNFVKYMKSYAKKYRRSKKLFGKKDQMKVLSLLLKEDKNGISGVTKVQSQGVNRCLRNVFIPLQRSLNVGNGHIYHMDNFCDQALALRLETDQRSKADELYCCYIYTKIDDDNVAHVFISKGMNGEKAFPVYTTERSKESIKKECLALGSDDTLAVNVYTLLNNGYTEYMPVYGTASGDRTLSIQMYRSDVVGYDLIDNNTNGAFTCEFNRFLKAVEDYKNGLIGYEELERSVIKNAKYLGNAVTDSIKICTFNKWIEIVRNPLFKDSKGEIALNTQEWFLNYKESIANRLYALKTPDEGIDKAEPYFASVMDGLAIGNAAALAKAINANGKTSITEDELAGNKYQTRPASVKDSMDVELKDVFVDIANSLEVLKENGYNIVYHNCEGHPEEAVMIADQNVVKLDFNKDGDIVMELLLEARDSKSNASKQLLRSIYFMACKLGKGDECYALMKQGLDITVSDKLGKLTDLDKLEPKCIPTPEEIDEIIDGGYATPILSKNFARAAQDIPSIFRELVQQNYNSAMNCIDKMQIALKSVSRRLTPDTSWIMLNSIEGVDCRGLIQLGEVYMNNPTKKVELIKYPSPRMAELYAAHNITLNTISKRLDVVLSNAKMSEEDKEKKKTLILQKFAHMKDTIIVFPPCQSIMDMLAGSDYDMDGCVVLLYSANPKDELEIITNKFIDYGFEYTAKFGYLIVSIITSGADEEIKLKYNSKSASNGADNDYDSVDVSKNMFVKENVDFAAIKTKAQFHRMANKLVAKYMANDKNDSVGTLTNMIESWNMLYFENDKNVEFLGKKAGEAVAEEFGFKINPNGNKDYVQLPRMSVGNTLKVVYTSNDAVEYVLNQLADMKWNASNVRLLIEDITILGRHAQELTIDAAKKLYKISFAFKQTTVVALSTKHFSENSDIFFGKEISVKKGDLTLCYYDKDSKKICVYKKDYKEIKADDEVKYLYNDVFNRLQTEACIKVIDFAVNAKNRLGSLVMNQNLAEYLKTRTSSEITTVFLHQIVLPYVAARNEWKDQVEAIREDKTLEDWQKTSLREAANFELECECEILSNTCRYICEGMTPSVAGAHFAAASMYQKDGVQYLNNYFIKIAPEFGLAFLDQYYYGGKIGYPVKAIGAGMVNVLDGVMHSTVETVSVDAPDGEYELCNVIDSVKRHITKDVDTHIIDNPFDVDSILSCSFSVSRDVYFKNASDIEFDEIVFLERYGAVEYAVIGVKDGNHTLIGKFTKYGIDKDCLSGNKIVSPSNFYVRKKNNSDAINFVAFTYNAMDLVPVNPAEYQPSK